MKLSLITNNLELATYANGLVDRLMIDLEYLGKKERQTGKDLFQSEHRIEDISILKPILSHMELMVRVNSIHDNTANEIDEVIQRGADIVMLPFFKTTQEVEYFIKCVGKRVKTSLLIETKEAVSILSELITYKEIDEYHIGLNDLSISLGNNTIFDAVLDGTIENCIELLKTTNKPYGFGGVGSLSNKGLTINPLLCLSEQIRLGCSIGWLGRSFRNLITDKDTLAKEIGLLRDAVSFLINDDMEFNHIILRDMIAKKHRELGFELKPYRI